MGNLLSIYKKIRNPSKGQWNLVFPGANPVLDTAVMPDKQVQAGSTSLCTAPRSQGKKRGLKGVDAGAGEGGEVARGAVCKTPEAQKRDLRRGKGCARMSQTGMAVRLSQHGLSSPGLGPQSLTSGASTLSGSSPRCSHLLNKILQTYTLYLGVKTEVLVFIAWSNRTRLSCLYLLLCTISTFLTFLPMHTDMLLRIPTTGQ